MTATDHWHETDDVHAFHARGGEFLRSRPDLHTTPLTYVEQRRVGAAGPGTGRFGWLERDGEVRAAYLYGVTSRRLSPTALTPGEAASLADHLTGLGHPLRSVVAVHDTATAFAGEWRRRTGADPAPGWRGRLHRLGTLTEPGPRPEGRARVAGEGDHDEVVRWCREFCVTVGETASLEAIDAGAWATTRFADKLFLFWETPDGTPVSLAASTPMTAGMVRVDPVSTPARFRRRGYAGAVTTAITRAALAGGAAHVVLYTDPANPTSNALYRRVGYVPLAEVTELAFGGTG